MGIVIRADALTTFGISPDGTRVRFGVCNDNGESSALELPADCIHKLLMTLPQIVQETLRRSRGDSSLRMAYPMEGFRLELGNVGADGLQRYLLTLQTDSSFEITFSLKDNLLGVVAQTIMERVVEGGQAVPEPVTLNS